MRGRRCRSFAVKALRGILADYPADVAVIFRHWPLEYHRFAYPAARAAECAAKQGRFDAFHDLVYDKQDSLGLKSFSSFAIESGVHDVNDFDKWNAMTSPVEAIDAGRTDARALKFTGTPAVLAYSQAPDSAQLHQLVADIVRQK